MYSNNNDSNSEFGQKNRLFAAAPQKIRRWYSRWWGRVIIIFLTIFAILLLAFGMYIFKMAYLLKTSQLTPQQLLGGQLSANKNAGFYQLISDTDPALGPTDAPVVIIEFSDFQCSACASAYPVVKQLLRNYGDEIRFVFKDMPGVEAHPQALLAALAGQCAKEQGKFWEMHNKIFENQSDISELSLKTYAVQLGLNSVAFGSCLNSDKYLADIESDLQTGISAGVEATPTFFVNGVMVRGAVPLEVFESMINVNK